MRRGAAAAGWKKWQQVGGTASRRAALSTTGQISGDSSRSSSGTTTGEPEASGPRVSQPDPATGPGTGCPADRAAVDTGSGCGPTRQRDQFAASFIVEPNRRDDSGDSA